ncbi:hypothetical protein O0I10_007556 [Lichtheimia ornata]|uniref:Zn(2)-C6 fungal-type domain-containing protein n=1 Tax=Lichtheimia ornata TaxID=688661 RepID=A0AAD7UZW4_9FUNG|nr:uncharacterized protein O0I10_007556 [Lichtheimia ornata]KAJ8656709.1 hypothetical protein O0I10_007556 [Lichtheimia ornata]
MNAASLDNGLLANQEPSRRVGKRMRITRACDMCRKKKVKCHATPGTACSNCIDAGTPCEFNQSAKKRGPPKGYIGALETRIERIERLLADQTAEQQKLSPTMSAASLTARGKKTSSNGDPLLYCRKLPRGALADRVRLIGDTSLIQQLFQYKIPAGRLDELGTSGVHYRLFGRQVVQMMAHSSTTGASPDIGCEERPQTINPELFFQRQTGVNFWIYSNTGADRHTSDRLLQIYFLNVHPILPVVNKTEFLKQYRDQADTYPSADLLNAMFGAASRYLVCESKRQRSKGRYVPPDVSWDVPSQWCYQFFEQASSAVTNSAWSSSISKVQAMLLLHNTSSHINAKESTAWILNGLAIRVAQGFGLNRCCDEWDIPDSEKELRKRVWWALHISDRFQATALGRPVSIREEDNDVTYPNPSVSWKEVLDEPEDEDDDATPRFPSATFRPESIQGEIEFYQLFIQLIKLSEILGRILQGLYTPRAQQYSIMQGSDAIVTQLDHELTQWRFGFPKALENTNFRDFDDQKGYFASSIASILLCYFACLILLHRPFIERQGIYATGAAAQDRPSYLSFRISTSAASRGIHIADQMTKRDFVMFPYAFNIYPIFQFCLIHIYNARNPDGRISAPGRTELRRAMGVVERLRSMSTASKMLYDVVGLITEALQADLGLQNNGQQNNDPNAFTQQQQQQPAAANDGYPPQAVTNHRNHNNDEESWNTMLDTSSTMAQQPLLHLKEGKPVDMSTSAMQNTTPASQEIYTLKQFGYNVPDDPKELDHMLQDMASYSKLETLQSMSASFNQQQQNIYKAHPSKSTSTHQLSHQPATPTPSIYASSSSSSSATPFGLYNTTTTTTPTSMSLTTTDRPFSLPHSYHNSIQEPFHSTTNLSNNMIPLEQQRQPTANASNSNVVFRNHPNNPFASLSSSMDWSEWYEWTQRATKPAHEEQSTWPLASSQ